MTAPYASRDRLRPTSGAPSSTTVGPVRLATVNLLHGRSLVDGEVREADLRAAARVLDADLVGLQEVDRGQPRSHGLHQVAAVADEMGARHWRFEPALFGTPGGPWSPARGGAEPGGPAYGVGLVSRDPVLHWRTLRFAAAPVPLPLLVPGVRGLPLVADEPRVALAAVVDGPVGRFTAITTHLSFVPGWNVAQLRRLVRWARALPAPRVLLGDLNLPGSTSAWASGWTQLARVPTYPAQRPRVQFDHVLAGATPAPGLPGLVRQVESLQLAVSDHRALVLDLDPAALR
jgi:endonuclease/exonuclease/phosphatase family metal-dependent hydrolase